MTADELRAKFEEWASEYQWSRDRQMSCEEDDSSFSAWQADHSSRDAEVETLRRRIDDAPVYYIPTNKPNSEEGWLQVIGSIKALNNMRGKHVRLVIDTAMREVE